MCVIVKIISSLLHKVYMLVLSGLVTSQLLALIVVFTLVPHLLLISSCLYLRTFSFNFMSLSHSFTTASLKKTNKTI